MGAVVPLDRSEGMLNQFLAFLHVFRVAADRNLNPRVRLFSPSEVVVRRVLFYVRDLLEGDLGIAIHVYRDVNGVIADLYFLCFPGIGAPVGTGAAGFFALVNDAVFSFMAFEQFPSDRAGYGPVLVPDKTADHTARLNLHRDRRVLITGRKYAGMQALADIFRFRGTACFFVDFGGNVFEIKDAFVLVIFEGDVGNRAVHQACFDVLTAFVSLVRDDLGGFNPQFRFRPLSHPVKQPLIRVGGCRVKRRDEVVLVIHHGLDIVGGQQSFLGVNGPALRVGLLKLICSGLRHTLLVALIFDDSLPNLLQLCRHILGVNIELKDSGVLFRCVLPVHAAEVFRDAALLLEQIVQLLFENLGREGLLPAIACADLRAVHGKRLFAQQFQLRAGFDKIPERRLKRFAVVLAENRNCPEIRLEPIEQIEKFYIPAALFHEPPGRADPVQVAVKIELQQIARVIGRPPCSRRYGARKPQRFHGKAVHIRPDHSDGIVFFYQPVKAVWQKLHSSVLGQSDYRLSLKGRSIVIFI